MISLMLFIMLECKSTIKYLCAISIFKLKKWRITNKDRLILISIFIKFIKQTPANGT